MFKKFLNRFFFGKSGAWTAIFTFVLMVFSGLLWKVNDKATETSIASQRAFVSASGPVIMKDIRGRKWVAVSVYYLWSNSGTTPAKNEASEWNMSLGPTIPGKGLDFDNLPQSERLSLVLGPKAGFQLPPVYLSTEDLEMVAEGKKHLFFWGWTLIGISFPVPPYISRNSVLISLARPGQCQTTPIQRPIGRPPVLHVQFITVTTRTARITALAQDNPAFLATFI